MTIIKHKFRNEFGSIFLMDARECVCAQAPEAWILLIYLLLTLREGGGLFYTPVEDGMY